MAGGAVEQGLKRGGPRGGVGVAGPGHRGDPSRQGGAGVEVAGVGVGPASQGVAREVVRGVVQQGERQRPQDLPPRIRRDGLAGGPRDLHRLDGAIFHPQHLQQQEGRLGIGRFPGDRASQEAPGPCRLPGCERGPRLGQEAAGVGLRGAVEGAPGVERTGQSSARAAASALARNRPGGSFERAQAATAAAATTPRIAGPCHRRRGGVARAARDGLGLVRRRGMASRPDGGRRRGVLGVDPAPPLATTSPDQSWAIILAVAAVAPLRSGASASGRRRLPRSLKRWMTT